MEHQFLTQLLQYFIWLPFVGFVSSALVSGKNERLLSKLTISIIGVHLTGIIALVLYWATNGFPTLDIRETTLFRTGEIEIFIDLFFDKTTAVFALTGSSLTFLVSIFSRYYLHRDEGFKRFFMIINLFFFSYQLVIFSGNFETLFIGWEVLGVCSFLLIAFYRDRYLPVKNALKVISVYRLGDICLILTMWMSHHLWHENITFLKLQDLQLVEAHLAEHYWYGVFISLMILIAAAAKSAQLPFSSWLPRAMEGPTTSSAIFYGSLSVHLGVFLLLRTYPYWESLLVTKTLVIVVGLATSVIATSIARVQSSVKSQIAYSSVTQIGLMFVEVALGYHVLALFHFFGNAFLRTYQLLVSPSVLSYLIHDMIFEEKRTPPATASPWLTKVKNSLYMLSVKEWDLDRFLQGAFWNPFKWVGKKLDFLATPSSAIVLCVLFTFGLALDLFPEMVPENVFAFLPHLFSLLGLILTLKAFSEKGDAMWAWCFAIAGQLYIALSIALLNENFGYNHIFLYLSGSAVSAAVGIICLRKIKLFDGDISLNQFHGYVYEHPKIGLVFLISCLGFVGLPFTPTFIGIDILFSHIHKHEELLIIFTALSFVFMELSIIRIYARIFLGQHKKSHHPIGYRSC